MTNKTYTIEVRDGVTIVRGSMEMMAMSKLLLEQPKGCFLNTDLSRILGALVAFGKPEDTEALLAKVKLTNTDRAPGLPADAAEWLANGEQGLSSMAIFVSYFGGSQTDLRTPGDPSDLGRCLNLLKQVPSIPSVEHMRQVSPAWNALVDDWLVLSRSYEREYSAPENHQRTAPTTYALLKEALKKGARQ